MLLAAFQWFSKVGATVMWLLGKRHNLKEDMRQSLYDTCNHWPNLSYLDVFGVLAALEGCEAFSEAKRETKIGAWFDRMKEVGGRREERELLA